MVLRGVLYWYGNELVVIWAPGVASTQRAFFFWPPILKAVLFSCEAQNFFFQVEAKIFFGRQDDNILSRP